VILLAFEFSGSGELCGSGLLLLTATEYFFIWDSQAILVRVHISKRQRFFPMSLCV
jgi:hypothetical protein